MLKRLRNISFSKHLPNLFFWGGVILFAVIIVSYSKDYLRLKKIDAEIDTLENELVSLQQKNIELSKLIKYLDSEAYVERKARTELGLKKPGESVVIVPNDTQQTSVIPENAVANKNLSNMYRWWKYFFQNSNT